MRIIFIAALVMLLLVIALPAVGVTDTMDNGTTLVNGDVLAPAGTPQATVKYVEAITGVAPDSHGGHRNIAK